jgi:hypothetical protein
MNKTFTHNANGSLTVREFPDGANANDPAQATTVRNIDADQVEQHMRDAELVDTMPAEMVKAIDAQIAVESAEDA